ncbi:hypothetical protein ACFHYQ_02045 [Sphaerimonospora cavernae]|uniref:Uncharacterized protein n=1 Tax=Sphaerimonospora cavernae TaxID=1740611 RepID=A0ABV6U1S6_9ACTN
MTRRRKRCAVPRCVLFAGLLAGHLLRATPVAHAHTHVQPDEVAQGASTGRFAGDASLSDVAGLSAKDIWAVGQQNVWDTWRNRGVITHWNGVSWTDVAIRGDATGAGHLRSVAAVSPSEIWVVGDGHDGLPYVAKGSPGGFDRVDVPQFRVGDWLGAVAASLGRVVTVGSRGGRAFMAVSGGAGKGWTTRSGPDGIMYGVALAGKSDGWAVGDSGSRPLMMRLSGGRWKPVDLPEIKGGFLRDVYAQSRKRAIAVGGVYEGDDDTIAPLVLRWDGKEWSRERPRSDGKARSRGKTLPGQAELYGVTGDGDGTFWAAGYDPAHPAEGFLLRRSGSRWTVIRGQAPPQKGDVGERTVRLQAVAHVTGLTVAVGHVLDAKGHYTDLVERFGPPSGHPDQTGRAGHTTAPSSHPESVGGPSPMRTTRVTKPPMKAATAAKTTQPSIDQPSIAASKR